MQEIQKASPTMILKWQKVASGGWSVRTLIYSLKVASGGWKMASGGWRKICPCGNGIT